MGTSASLVPGLYGPVLGGYSCLCTTFSLVFLTHLNLYFNVQDNLQLRLILSFSQGKIWPRCASHLLFRFRNGKPICSPWGGFHPGFFSQKRKALYSNDPMASRESGFCTPVVMLDCFHYLEPCLSHIYGRIYNISFSSLTRILKVSSRKPYQGNSNLIL